MEKGRKGKRDSVGGSGTERQAISARTSPLLSLFGFAMSLNEKLHIPHSFPSLRNGPRKPVLVCGAGLSVGVIPSLQDLARKCPQAEKMLGCSVPRNSNDLNRDGYLYDWAEVVYQQLKRRNERFPKLRIADALGLLDDPIWQGKINIPLRGTWPRHRVIARFARESKWHAIWSLNWDCLIEAGLESVGIEEGEGLTIKHPWPTKYVTYITSTDSRTSDLYGTITIYKPHGCVKSLIGAREAEIKGNGVEAERLADRFIITKTDLSNLEKKFNDPTDRIFFCHFCSHVATKPLVAIGWSVSEDYLVQIVQKALEAQNRPDCCDELTIVDIDFNNKGHKRLAQCYCCDENKAHVKVSPGPSGFTTDRLLLWVQALYALECLERHCDTDDHYIGNLCSRYQNPIIDDFVIDWVDDFLPSWVRLCWRQGLVAYYKNGKPVPRNSINIEKQDEHIPLHIEGISRPDLWAASRLLQAIGKNEKNWDFGKFPGAFWRPENGLLLIPLPVWGERNQTDLTGLRVLLKHLDQDFGYVRKMGILLVAAETAKPITREVVDKFKAKLAGVCQRIQYANLAGTHVIETYSLEDL
jgi:hypothetical protein